MFEDACKSKETLLSMDGLPEEMKGKLLIEINGLKDKIMQLNEEMIGMSMEGRKENCIAAAVMKVAENGMGIAANVEVIE